MQQKALSVIKEIEKVIIGKETIIRKVLMAILAQGHILLEDTPGVGKTTLALAFAKTMDLDYKRIQFTPEIMPADVVGFSIYNKVSGKLEYQPGAALCNLLLVDEINRASSKTQSALLEVMEEGCITLDGITHEVPRPYTVIATQNPIGSAGTQLLPESQMDRFMVRLSLGYPGLEDEVRILKKKQGRDLLQLVKQVVNDQEILQMQRQAEAVHLDDDIYIYIARLAAATREHPLISLGVSPRGSITLVRMSQSAAWLAGRDYVIPSDVQFVIFDVFEHRLVLNSQARISNTTAHNLLKDIIKAVSPPGITQTRSGKW
ncbi:MAG TPA: MoxR family ATPase [Desulfosporosinus sp.]|nr:MoxR family ATPase [Desulfosporosinus sp.]